MTCIVCCGRAASTALALVKKTSANIMYPPREFVNGRLLAFCLTERGEAENLVIVPGGLLLPMCANIQQGFVQSPDMCFLAGDPGHSVGKCVGQIRR